MANVGMVGLDWQERVNWDRLRKYRLERAHEGARAWRDAPDVRRERALCDQHPYPRLEPPEARPALLPAVRRRRAGALRAGRYRAAHPEAFAVDTQGKHPLLVRLDQGRRRTRIDPAGDEI